MEKQISKTPPILDSEMFNNGSRHYYFDLMVANNRKHYFRITRLDTHKIQSSKRTQIIFFEDDLFFFTEALLMLLGRYASGNIGTSC